MNIRTRHREGQAFALEAVAMLVMQRSTDALHTENE